LIKKSITKRHRVKAIGSKYRGVSRNKNKWQVMIMGNFKKFYIGGIKTELEAAKLYDKLAIFYHGIEAKTNFQYTKRQIEALIAEPVES
jgi:AP2-like factor, euAP2 lineage